MDKIICQIWIAVFGAASIWFVARKEKWKRWGYILGMIGEPAWVYTTIKHEQWGMFLLTLWYTYAWGQGVYNYWIKVENGE